MKNRSVNPEGQGPPGDLPARVPAFRSGADAAGLVALLSVAALTIAIRVHLAGVPLERDEGEYAYAGRLLLDGVPPYENAYNMKFPGIYAVYAGILALFGASASGIRIGLLAVNLATAAFVFSLCRRFRGIWVSAVAASAYLILAGSPGVLGIFGHATQFMSLPVLAGVWLLVRSGRGAGGVGRMRLAGGGWRSRRWALLAAGACFGAAVLLKQHAIFYPLVGAMILLWGGAPPTGSLRTTALSLGWFVLGLATPLLATGGVLVATGVWERFYFWTFAYAREYVSITPFAEAIGTFAANGRHAIRGSEPFWALALIGLISLLGRLGAGRFSGSGARFSPAVDRGANPVAGENVRSARSVEQTEDRPLERLVLLGLLAASVCAIVPGFYFRPHYFVLLLPSVAWLAAIGIEALCERMGRSIGGARRAVTVAAMGVGLFSVCVVVQLGTWRDVLFGMTPHQVSRALYGPDPFSEAGAIAEYIRNRTDEADTIAVIGSEPEIYFLAERPAATGYLYTYALMEPQRFARRMQDEMMQEIESAHPTILVYPQIGTSWSRQDGSDPAIFEWINRYTRECYDLVGIIDIHSPEATAFVWDADTRGYRPQSENLVFVFRRKSDAPCGVGG